MTQDELGCFAALAMTAILPIGLVVGGVTLAGDSVLR